MSASLSFKTRSGGDPETLILGIKQAFQITEGDLLTALQIVRTGIRERTSQGVDVDGAQFAPYSTKGPYYYNPGTRGGKGVASIQRSSVKPKRAVVKALGETELKAQRGSASRLLRKLKGTGATLSKSGRSIKFASYAAFKAAFGRGGVDLMGVASPHMLDSIVAQSGGTQLNGDREIGPNEGSNPATVATLGIYDSDAAARANGHQNGIPGRLPQRRFFGASEQDKQNIVAILKARILRRIENASR